MAGHARFASPGDGPGVSGPACGRGKAVTGRRKTAHRGGAFGCGGGGTWLRLLGRRWHSPGYPVAAWIPAVAGPPCSWRHPHDGQRDQVDPGVHSQTPRAACGRSRNQGPTPGAALRERKRGSDRADQGAIPEGFANRRTARAPSIGYRSAARQRAARYWLLELRAELAEQCSDAKAQVADYTAVIAILSEQPTEQFSARLGRLYRSRGERVHHVAEMAGSPGGLHPRHHSEDEGRRIAVEPGSRMRHSRTGTPPRRTGRGPRSEIRTGPICSVSSPGDLPPPARFL